MLVTNCFVIVAISCADIPSVIGSCANVGFRFILTSIIVNKYHFVDVTSFIIIMLISVIKPAIVIDTCFKVKVTFSGSTYSSIWFAYF